MFFACYENTMRNARPKIAVAETIVRTIEQIRAEKRIETERLRREQAKAWVARMEARHQAEMDRLAAVEKDIPAFILPDGFSVPGQKMPVQEIIAGVAATHNIPVVAILSTRRDRLAVAARFDAIVAVRTEHPHLSLTQVGKIFKRDHTSIHHCLQIMAARAAKTALSVCD